METIGLRPRNFCQTSSLETESRPVNLVGPLPLRAKTGLPNTLEKHSKHLLAKLVLARDEVRPVAILKRGKRSGNKNLAARLLFGF